jgi:putative PIN family toxin of toxin-antitoxin system
LITSPAAVEEVVAVLSRVDLIGAKSIRAIDANRIIALLRQAPRVTPTVTVRVCRDPDDDKFIEAALSAQADDLVTGDKDLQALDGYEGLKVRYPAEFLKEVGRDARD